MKYPRGDEVSDLGRPRSSESVKGVNFDGADREVAGILKKARQHQVQAEECCGKGVESSKKKRDESWLSYRNVNGR